MIFLVILVLKKNCFWDVTKNFIMSLINVNLHRIKFLLFFVLKQNDSYIKFCFLGRISYLPEERLEIQSIADDITSSATCFEKVIYLSSK